jgi:hypothetical protein
VVLSPELQDKRVGLSRIALCLCLADVHSLAGPEPLVKSAVPGQTGHLGQKEQARSADQLTVQRC